MSTSKNVLITGGTGFIGSALASALQNRGWRVTVLTRNAFKGLNTLPHGTDCIEQLPTVSNWHYQIVVNLAGENLFERRWTKNAKQTFRHSRLGTTQKIVEAIEAGAPVELLVSGSAIGYYGPRGDTKLNENSPAGDDFSAHLCVEWENAAMEASNHCSVATLRTGVVLDLRGGALSRMLTPFKCGIGGRLGNGKQWFSWISRRDVVALIIFIINQHKQGNIVSGPWNATAAEPVTNSRFTTAIGSALKRPTALPMPAFMLKVMMGESANLLVTGQRVIPERALNAGFIFADKTIEAAMNKQLT